MLISFLRLLLWVGIVIQQSTKDLGKFPLRERWTKLEQLMWRRNHCEAGFSGDTGLRDCLLKRKDPVSQVCKELLTCFPVCSSVTLCFCCLRVFPVGKVDKGQCYCETDEWWGHCHPNCPCRCFFPHGCFFCHWPFQSQAPTSMMAINSEQEWLLDSSNIKWSTLPKCFQLFYRK